MKENEEKLSEEFQPIRRNDEEMSLKDHQLKFDWLANYIVTRNDEKGSETLQKQAMAEETKKFRWLIAT